MTNNYLKNVPTDKAWLNMRNEQWLGIGKPQGLKHRLFKHQDDPQTEIEAFRKYFFEGDVHAFIQTSKRISFSNIIFYSPVQSLESMQFVISEAGNWLLHNQNKIPRDGENKKPDIKEYLSHILNRIISPPRGNYFPTQLSVELFFWMFGEKYEKHRRIEVTKGKKPIVLDFETDVTYLCLKLLRGVRDYIWSQEEGEDYTSFKQLIDYFISIYPKYDPVFYSKTLPPSSAFGIGKSINQAHYIYPRWLIANLHGIVIDDYDLDRDEEAMSSLIINDETALAQLKSGMDRIKMPDEYYELEKFVIEHGSDCIDS